MNIRSFRLGSLALLLAGGGFAYSQSVTTGALQVTVLDTGGTPVAGASVRVSSGQITRTLNTGADGRAFFSLLNGGSWQISVSKSGMATLSQNVVLSVNETKPVNLKMAKESGATVEVVAAAKTVDATSLTTGTNFSLETVDAVPKGRDVAQMVFLSPGVTSSGFSSKGMDVTINGASGAENAWSIDGLSTTDFRYGGRGASLNTDFIDQMDVQTGGFKPEFSALGGVINMITKSGSNDFHGTFSVSTTPTGFFPKAKRTNFTIEQNQTGGTDVAAWVGGALIKDTLFYSVGAQGNFTTQKGQTNFSGFSGDDTKGTEDQAFVKLNWYITPNQQITANLTHNGLETKQTYGVPLGGAVSATAFGDANLGATTTNNNTGASIAYDWTINPSMFLSAKLGQSRLVDKVDPTASEVPIINDRHWFQGATSKQAVPGGGAGTLPSYLTDDTTIYHRGGYGLYTHEYMISKQGNINFTWILGDHSLKAGFSDLQSEYDLWERVSGGHRYTIDGSGGRLRDRVISNDAGVKAVYRGYYVQDDWQVTPRLHVFYGARAEDQDQLDSNNQKVLSFKASDYVQPRLGFTWDVQGNGKSKLSGSFAHYYESIPQRLTIREFAGESFIENRYYSNLRKAGAKGQYVYSSATNQVGSYNASTPDLVVNYGASFLHPPVQDGIKLPRRKEILLGYQQTFDNGWSAGLNLKYRKLENVIEDSVFVDADGNTLVDKNGHGDDYTLGGQPAIIWNPGSTLKYKGIGADGNPLQYDFTGVNTLYPKAYNEYKAAEFSLEKKADRYYFSLNYTLSRSYGNYQGLVSSSNGQPDANITASFDFWPYVGTGLLPLDRTHQLKMYGSYKLHGLGHPLTLGASVLLQRVPPTGHLDDGTATYGDNSKDFGSYGNDIPVDLKLGQFGRRPTSTKLDLHAEMEFTAGNMKVSPYIDVFNAYNSRPITNTAEQLTDSGGNPQPAGYADSATAWQAGRSFRFGAKLRF